MSIRCRLGYHRWMRYMPSWGKFRYCGRCYTYEYWKEERWWPMEGIPRWPK